MRSRLASLALAGAALTPVVFGAQPAFAADYTLDCTATPSGGFADANPSDEYNYYALAVAFDGTGPASVSVTVQGCDYHLASDSSPYFYNDYVGWPTVATYSLTIPVDGIGEVRGYNTAFGSPANTGFTVSFTNPAPIDNGGGGGDSGGGDSGGGSDTVTSLSLDLHADVGSEIGRSRVDLSGSGLQASSEYVLELHSAVVELATGTTDENGDFTATVRLPRNVTPGAHEIVLRGTDPDGNPVQRITYIVVDDSGVLTALSTRKPIDESTALASTGMEEGAAATLLTASLALIAGGIVIRRRRASASSSD